MGCDFRQDNDIEVVWEESFLGRDGRVTMQVVVAEGLRGGGLFLQCRKVIEKPGGDTFPTGFFNVRADSIDSFFEAVAAACSTITGDRDRRGYGRRA